MPDLCGPAAGWIVLLWLCRDERDRRRTSPGCGSGSSVVPHGGRGERDCANTLALLLPACGIASRMPQDRSRSSPQGKDGAEVIVLWCADMTRHRRPREEALDIPVIDPTQAAVAMALGAWQVAPLTYRYWRATANLACNDRCAAQRQANQFRTIEAARSRHNIMQALASFGSCLAARGVDAMQVPEKPEIKGDNARAC
jgi:hypothetical protein